MARKPKPLPDHLEELISALEKQDTPDRLAAVRAVEEKHGVEIDLELVIAEYEAFAERYARWRRKITMGLEDRSISNALAGRASATTILRGQGLLKSAGSRSEADRPTLSREHRSRVAAARKGW